MLGSFFAAEKSKHFRDGVHFIIFLHNDGESTHT